MHDLERKPIEPAIRGVILDMDGLMLDTEGMSRAAWRKTLAERGLSLSDERYLELIGLTLSDVGKKMRVWYGADIPYDSIYKRKLVLVDEIIASDGIPQKPGLTALLDALDSLGLRKAVATSTSRDRAMYKLKIAGVAAKFEAFVGGDDVARGKPAPDIFLRAADRLTLPPQECLVLEDSDPGVLAARAAGMRVIIVPDMKPPSPDAAAAGWQVLPDLNRVAIFLTQYFSARMEDL
jgi:HAD superfamily hydrolase (TIGR01509 family)